ncbi:uncharacterized protein LOC116350919 [Contarinia nasturtii]|uniref:uncharacterized protein LOC116350919 n=1 Tax=Contarinia nasturtii TaxID=265458 RepID=UPI0012D3A019|nr:uncharacterized protein LOC116350919 [Contarinia nasturtii]
MKPIPTAQQMMIWLCQLPPENSTSVWKKLAYIGFTIVMTLAQFTLSLASVAFILKNGTNNFEQTLFAACVFISALGAVYIELEIVFMQHRFSNILKNLATIYGANKHEDSFQFLEQVNNKCEWIWKFYLKWVVTSATVSFPINGIASIIFCYYLHGELNRDHLYIPFYFVLPWDQATLLGYGGEICTYMSFAVSYYLICGVVMLTFISMCFHHQAFYEMFRHELRKLNDPDENINQKKLLCKIIEFHSSVREWFLYSSDVYTFIIMIKLLYSMLCLAICIFDLMIVTNFRFLEVIHQIHLILFCNILAT